MAVPKRKHSKQRTRVQRNARYKRSVTNTIKCKKCDADKLPHRVCAECGSEK